MFNEKFWTGLEMVVSILGRSLSFVNAQYKSVACHADVGSSKYVFQFKNNY